MRWAAYEQHIAIVADYPGDRLSVIHALKRSGGVVEHRLDERWLKSVIAVYAFPGAI
jgi:hypothetical protein